MPKFSQTTDDETPEGGFARALKWVGFAAGAAVAGAAVAASLGLIMARRVVVPEPESVPDITVESIERHGDELRVWLSGPGAGLPGQYSLLFAGGDGHAKLGPVVGRAGAGARRRFSRRLVAVDRGRLVEGARGSITGWWYDAPEELGHEVERIALPLEGGDAEAWIVRPRRAKKGRWAVHVHGRGALPQETLRGVGPCARAGVTSLVISYRNDPGAPTGAFGRYGLGLSERRDVDAAITEAERRGAERVTLFGWSMGATACLLAGNSGPHARLVDGFVLDSPAVDWVPLLQHHAELSRLPSPVGRFGVALLDRGLVRGGEDGGLDFSQLDAERFARELRVPVLIHASEQDSYVPATGAKRLAAARPRFVDLRLQKRGEHVRLWNVDPETWETATEHFVRSLPRPGA